MRCHNWLLRTSYFLSHILLISMHQDCFLHPTPDLYSMVVADGLTVNTSGYFSSYPVFTSFNRVVSFLREASPGFHFAFTSDVTDLRMLEVLSIMETLSDEGNVFVGVQAASCQVISTNPSANQNNGHWICNSHYASVIGLLGDYFFTHKIAIITSRARCVNRLAEDVLLNLKTRYVNTVTSGLSHFSTEVRLYKLPDIDDAANISSTIHQIKSMQASLVILLADSHTSRLVFSVASVFGLTGYQTTWITIEYADSNFQDYMPLQMLDVRVAKDLQWMPEVLNRVVRTVTDACDDAETHNSSSSESLIENLQLRLMNVDCSNRNQRVDVVARNTLPAPLTSWERAFSWTSQSDMLTILAAANELIRIIKTPLQLVHLTVATIIDPPFTTTVDHLETSDEYEPCVEGFECRMKVVSKADGVSLRWEVKCCVGIMMDLLAELASDLKFLPHVYIVEDGFYGGKDKASGQWNGLLGDVIKGKADLAIAALTFNSERSKIVDFSEPYMRIDLSILISASVSPLSFINWDFIRPLDAELRYWIFIVFVLGTIVLYGLENRNLVLQRVIDPTIYARYSWREGFSYFTGLSFQRELGGKNPLTLGARMTAIVFAFAMVTIMSTYTAVLTASKVQQESSSLFLGFKDPKIQNPTENFKFAVLRQTSIEAYFEQSKNEIYRRMYLFMKKYNVNSTYDGVEMVKNGSLNAFIDEYPFLSHHVSKQSDCGLKTVGEPIPQGGYSLVLPKGSLWTQPMSEVILKLKESERMDEINRKWISNMCQLNATATETAYSRLPVEYFGGLIFVLAIVLIISLVLLGAEHFCFRHHRRVINPIQDKVQEWRETKAAGRRNALIDENDIAAVKMRHSPRPTHLRTSLQNIRIDSIDRHNSFPSMLTNKEVEEDQENKGKNGNGARKISSANLEDLRKSFDQAANRRTNESELNVAEARVLEDDYYNPSGNSFWIGRSVSEV